MELWTFIEENWFELTAIASLFAFGWKISKAVTTYIDSINSQIKSIKSSMDSIHKKYDSQFEDMKTRIDQNRQETQKKLSEIENKRNDSIERTRLIMEGVEATLVTLHEQGYNGPVTQSLTAIRDYKNRKAAQD